MKLLLNLHYDGNAIMQIFSPYNSEFPVHMILQALYC